MAISNSYNFNMNRNEIVKAALRKLNAIDQFEEPTEAEVRDSAQALNLLIKSWQSQGLHLWKYEEITIFLENDKILYSLSPAGDHAAFTSDVVQTSTTAAASSGASNITVDSIVGLASGDYIGIILSDGSSQWTTINGAPAGSTVTLTDVLIGDVDSGAVVYSYTTRIQKPMRIVDARRRNSQTTTVPVQIIAREKYFDLPNKESTGLVSQLHYNPKISSGNLYIWPSPSDLTFTLRCSVEYPIADFDTAVDDPDFPSEWLRPLIFNLAVDLAPEFGNIAGNELQQLKALADEYKQDALDYDMEYTEVQFAPVLDDSFSYGR